MAATKAPYKIDDGCPQCENEDAIEGLGGTYICTSCENEIDSSRVTERSD